MITKYKDRIVETTTKTTYFEPLEKELIEIEDRLKDLEKGPDEILMPNDMKFGEMERLNNRKQEILHKYGDFI